MSPRKNQTIETLRGLAILLVVMGHVIGSAPDGGMKIDFPSTWRYLYSWIDYIQMPLFTAIAGWVYALRPIGQRDLVGFVGAKFKRLILPLIAVATTYFIVQHLTPGTNNKEAWSSLWRIYLFPYTMFWYLQTLFLIFITVALIEQRGWMQNLTRWRWVLASTYLIAIAQITLVSGHSNNLFSFEGAMAMLPYFLVGLGVGRFSEELFRIQWAYYTLATVGIILLQINWFYSIDPVLYHCLMPLWIIPTLIICLKQHLNIRLFTYLGGYAYSIYLLHGFGTAGGRIIMHQMGIHNQMSVFLVSLAVALLIPIVADRVLTKNRYTAMLFLGKRMPPQ